MDNNLCPGLDTKTRQRRIVILHHRPRMRKTQPSQGHTRQISTDLSQLLQLHLTQNPAFEINQVSLSTPTDMEERFRVVLLVADIKELFGQGGG